MDEDEPRAAGMIVPCLCRGSQKFVHRDCLDSWRATNPHGRAFTNCTVCGFEYRIVPVEESEEEKRAERTRLLRFRLFVARDTAAVFLLLQLVIMGLGAAVWALDKGGRIMDFFPESIGERTKTAYYLSGLVLFLALLGVMGLLYACLNGLENTLNNRHHHYHHGPNCVCCCDDCYCCMPRYHHGCCYYGRAPSCNDCGGSRSGGEGCLAVIVALVVVFAFIGLFVGVFLASIVFQRIMQRHMRVLWLREQTKRYVVQDFFGNPDALEEAGRHDAAARASEAKAAAAAAPRQPLPSAPSQWDVEAGERDGLLSGYGSGDSAGRGPGRSFPKELWDD